MIKLIVSDLDGTLFNASHKLDEISANAIHKAQEAGIIFMVATGRARKNVLPFFEEFNIQCPKILLNGAMYVNEQNKPEDMVLMNHDDVRKVMALMEDNGMVAHIYCSEGIACTNVEKMISEFRTRLKTREQLSDEEIDFIVTESGFCDYDIHITDLEEFLKEHPQIFKVEAFANDEESIRLVRDELYKMKQLDVSNSVGDNIEVTDTKAQKGTMLKKLCLNLGINEDEVITVGDSLNDLSMIRDFPNSYAVANACEEIKKVASNITETNLNHGVAKIIHEVLDRQGR